MSLLTLLLPLGASADARHRETWPYVLGAVVIAILAVALMLQLIARTKRERRR